MPAPKPGERFRKNGKIFVVHRVMESEVYGALYRDVPGWGEPDDEGMVVGAISLARIDLADFDKATKDALRSDAAEDARRRAKC